MEYIRSPFFYVGDKYKIIPQIQKHFPKNINKFIEPFTGGGSVFLNVEANQYMLNDIDTNIVSIHKELKNNSNDFNMFYNNICKKIELNNLSHSFKEDKVPKELKKQFKKTYYAKYNKEGYNNLKKIYNASENKDYIDLYILLIYGFNRMLRFNSKKEFNLPVGNVDYNKNVHYALENYMNRVKENNIDWYNLDYKNFLNNINIEKNDFIYLDPPYLISNSEYNKLWNNTNENELLDFLDELNDRNVKFAISNVVEYRGCKNDIFEEWMRKYKVEEITSNYISFNNNKQKNIREVLVKNYE